MGRIGQRGDIMSETPVTNQGAGGSVGAVDFDGMMTIGDRYPGIGQPNMPVIRFLRLCVEEGHRLILNTCRMGQRLEEAVAWCDCAGVKFAAVNENLPERVARYGGDPRKISADWYLDDRNLAFENIKTWPEEILEVWERANPD